MSEGRAAVGPGGIRVLGPLPGVIRCERRGIAPARRGAVDQADVVHLDGIVRTVLGTARTADAPVFNDDLAGCTLVDRADRTADQADRVFALTASGGHEVLTDARAIEEEA